MKVAAVDIGSNSTRLLILDEEGKERCREMNITRLAQGVDAAGNLAPEAMSRTIGVLERYGQLIRDERVQAIRVTGTSAARDASNRDEFFQGVHAAVGAMPELLSGQEEAALAFAGATGERRRSDRRVATLDIGGGSTEFAVGALTPEASLSLDIGCVRVTERFLSGDPPTPAQLGAASNYVRSLLERADREVACRGCAQWLGMAGTVTSLAAWDLGLERYDPTRTHGHKLKKERVEAMHEELTRRDTKDRAALLLEAQRAPVILGGSLILVETLRHFDLEAIEVSERDILDGLAASLRPAEE